MKSISRLSIPLLFFMAALSCGKNTEEKTGNANIFVCYDETKGADPWLSPLNSQWPELKDSILISYVKDFLVADTITVYNISINHDGQFDPCKSPFCTTGRRIKVFIDKSDLIKIKEARFYECY